MHHPDDEILRTRRKTDVDVADVKKPG